MSIVSSIYLLLETSVLIFTNKDIEVNRQAILLVKAGIIDSNMYIRLLYIL